MKTLFIALKVLVNFLLFAFYSLVFIIASNFIFWLVLNILWRDVPSGEDPIHMKMALLIIFLSLLITLLYRNFFYLNVFNILNRNYSNIKSNDYWKDKVKNIEDKDLEIYINKEIK